MVSHWRHLLELARGRNVIPPFEKDEKACPRPSLTRAATLHLLRQRSILQEEWISSVHPLARNPLPSLLSSGSSTGPQPVAPVKTLESGFSTSTRGSFKGSDISAEPSFWAHVPFLHRCYSSLTRRCSRRRPDPPAHGQWSEDAWAFDPDPRGTWLRAFAGLSLAPTPRDWAQRSLRSRTVPSLDLQPTKTLSGGPLIELLYLISFKAPSQGGEVLWREPRRRRGQQSMLDERIASFCSSWGSPAPFTFTVLAAVLPQDDDSECVTADPTDFLYCTALCFEEAGQLRAFCLVSRHPFLDAFGKLLLLLRDGKEALAGQSDEVCVQPTNLSGVNADVPPEDPLYTRLCRTVQRLRQMVPKVRAELTRRAATVPVSMVPTRSPRLECKQMGENEEEQGLCADSFAYPPCHWPQGACLGRQEARRRMAVLVEWSATEIFGHFTLQAVMDIVLALLLEFRIVVISEARELGSQLVLGLTALLWPFSWQHLQLPICPPYLQEAILDAPVPFICALPEVTGQVASASSATFTPRGMLGTTSARQGVVLCDADAGVVSIPPRSDAFLRPQLSHLEAVQQDCHAGCRLSEDEDSVKDSTEAMAWAKKIQGALVALAEDLTAAHDEVKLELGTSGWRQQMEAKLAEASPSSATQALPFFQAFLNTETCLMFLAVDS